MLNDLGTPEDELFAFSLRKARAGVLHDQPTLASNSFAIVVVVASFMVLVFPPCSMAMWRLSTLLKCWYTLDHGDNDEGVIIAVGIGFLFSGY